MYQSDVLRSKDIKFGKTLGQNIAGMKFLRIFAVLKST
jgi:hypothetical protein